MELNVTVTAQDGRQVRMTAAQSQAVQALNNTRRGGCSSVTGYIPSSGWVTSPVHNIQMLTNISVRNLYKRRLAALEEIEYGDISRAAADDEMLKDMKVSELLALFDKRKEMQLKSINNMLSDGPKNAHSTAHDTCYARIGNVKVHLVTEKVKGLMEPVVNSGCVTLASIMVQYLELNTTVVKEGERKVVKSGAPVRIGNLIERCVNKRSVALKTLSLKEDNFESFHASGQELLPEDVTRFGDILES